MKTITKCGKIRNFPLSKLFTLSRKNAISPKVFNRFSKTFPSSWKMWKIGIWAEKFHWRSYFSFLMVRWKPFFWWKNSKFPTFQVYTLSEKFAISPKEFSRFSKTFHLLKDVDNRYFAQKFHGRSYFSFAMVRLKPFFWWKNSKFPTFKLYTVSEKTLYHERYSTDFQKLSICWKMWKIGILPENFVGAAILVLQW